MKFDLYDEENNETIVRLRLIKNNHNISLCVVTEDGTPENTLLIFQEDGVSRRCSSVNPKYGFNLDGNRKLVFTD